MNYDLFLEHYQGPLDKLLELIEEKKLEITLVSLAQVTADFLNYIKKLENDDEISRRLITDFISIASKLLVLKSKILMPSLELEEDEENEIKNLEIRLKIYREIKQTQIFIRNQWKVKSQMFNRELLTGSGPLFYPPSKLTKEELYKVFFKIVEELERTLKPIETVKTEIINLQKKIEEIVKRLTEKPISLKSLRKQETRGELIALFLAILHLIKDQLIHVEQEKNFEEIQIAKNV